MMHSCIFVAFWGSLTCKVYLLRFGPQCRSCVGLHFDPQKHHGQCRRPVADSRTNQPVGRGSKNGSNCSSKLALSISHDTFCYHLRMGFTFDRKLPIALPRCRSEAPPSSESQHEAAAAVRPVTTVALVYAKKAAAEYNTNVAIPPSRIKSRGRQARSARASEHERIPRLETFSSPILAREGRTCRA